MTTSGLRYGRSTWRRSAWKYCAGVVKLQTCQLSLTDSVEEAIETRVRVLGPLPLHAVRQQQDEAAHAVPLRLRRGQELVDDDLRGVHEVAELRLPDREPLGHVEAVAVLEAEHARLGQRAVARLEDALLVADVLERRVLRLRLRVEERRVAVAERAAPRVLTRQPHADALREQRPEGERLAHAPVAGLFARAPSRRAPR